MNIDTEYKSFSRNLYSDIYRPAPYRGSVSKQLAHRFVGKLIVNRIWKYEICYIIGASSQPDHLPCNILTSQPVSPQVTTKYRCKYSGSMGRVL